MVTFSSSPRSTSQAVQPRTCALSPNRRVTESQIRSALRLVNSGEPVALVARDAGRNRVIFYRQARSLSEESLFNDSRAPSTVETYRRKY